MGTVHQAEFDIAVHVVFELTLKLVVPADEVTLCEEGVTPKVFKGVPVTCMLSIAQ